MAKNTDWVALKKENKDLESYLEEWCVKDEVPYLRKWSYDFAEIRADDLGIKSGTESYSHLHIVIHNEVLWQTATKISDFLDKCPGKCESLIISLATYEDMARMIENIRKATSTVNKESKKYLPSAKKLPVTQPKRDSYSAEEAYSDEKNLTRQVECSLLEFISLDDLNELRRTGFDYADKKARSYGFLSESKEYAYLQAVVRHELMSEAEEYLVVFSDGEIEQASKIVKGLIEHNDLDMFLRQYDSKFRKN
jgi:hypothetical protein